MMACHPEQPLSAAQEARIRQIIRVEIEADMVLRSTRTPNEAARMRRCLDADLPVINAMREGVWPNLGQEGAE